MESAGLSCLDQCNDDHRRWLDWVATVRESLRLIQLQAESIHGLCVRVEESDRLYSGNIDPQVTRALTQANSRLSDELAPLLRVGPYIRNQWPGIYDLAISLGSIVERLDDEQRNVDATLIEGLSLVISRSTTMIEEMDAVDVNAILPESIIAPIVEAFSETTRKRTRDCYGRDHQFLQWNETGIKDAAIRDRWNALNKEQQHAICPARAGSKVTRETVISAIKSARRERGDEK